MIGHARSLALVGLDAVPVRIAATATPCDASARTLTIRVLPDHAAREARVRVASALAFDSHACDVAVEGFPAGASAAGLDLAIAAACLRAVGCELGVHPDAPIVGELALDGRVRAVRGALALVDGGARVIPRENAPEVAPFAECHSAERLADLLGVSTLLSVGPAEWSPLTDWAGVRPHELTAGLSARVRDLPPRALLVGPSGSGKTLLARAAHAALPTLTRDEARDVTRIHGVAGIVDGPATRRPLRAPHHTVSDAGLVGGGTSPRPGEVSLAHHGTLLLDELPEFRRSAIEALAGALRAGEATIARSGALCRFPAHPALVVATANPCPCGYRGHPSRACRCSDGLLLRWESRLGTMAGALGLERIEVPALSAADLAARGGP